MNSRVVFNEKKRSEYFSLDEYEDSSEMFLILAELRSKYDGLFIIEFDDLNKIEIDFDFEFIV